MNIYVVANDAALPLDRQRLVRRMRSMLADTEAGAALGCEIIGHDEIPDAVLGAG
ncbi:hypothetical protein [Bifidobacterium sp. AGR2158]|uniref:hypothetical protein n=1 Tax=Bifidobacterium sp. AGR2158 TaxID=1280675 RepID=UPI0012DDAD49|nr:hypothetical protein [Bifidobacterium sp. AGR2158]